MKNSSHKNVLLNITACSNPCFRIRETLESKNCIYFCLDFGHLCVQILGVKSYPDIIEVCI